MGDYKYPKEPHIQARLDRAINHFEHFLGSVEDKERYKLHLRSAIKKFIIKLVEYQSSKKVNMEHVELLRDVVFLGTSLMETTEKNHHYFRSLIASCFDIVEECNNVTFDDDFVVKIVSSKKEFMDSLEVKTVSLYYIFKSHFRYTNRIAS